MEEESNYTEEPSTSSEIPQPLHQYVDEQGRPVYLEDQYYYDASGAAVIFDGTFEEFAEEQVFQEDAVQQEFPSQPSQPSSSTHSTTKSQLIKEPYGPNTVLLTARSLAAENAQFIAKAGKRAKSTIQKEDDMSMKINKNGSSLNKNLPGMKNMFKVMSESTLKKADEFLKAEKAAEEQKLQDKILEVENPMEVREALEDDEEDGTPPPMERIVDDLSEYPDTRFDQWPLYSNQSIDFKDACEILVGIQPIDVEKVCKSVPKQFKHEGTFIIDTRLVGDLIKDDNGGWEKPSGKCRYYRADEWGNLVRADDGRGRLKEGVSHFSYKIMLKRYESKMTKNADEGRGQFQKKIYTGTKGDNKINFAIITYSWCSGRPWSFVPALSMKDVKKPTNWEKKSFEKVNMSEMPQMVSAFYEGFNIYSHCIVNFDEAAAIMLGGTAVDNNKLCSSVPLGYRQNGTFVIDLKRMGNCLLELRRDDNGLWHKPSGFSRFYKFAVNGDAVRIDKAGKLPPGMDFDVKVSSKRYEHTQVDKKFVRKIYTAKGKNSDSFHGSPDYAVIVYYWKGDPIPFDPAYKQNSVRSDAKEFARYQQMDEEETEFVEATEPVDIPDITRSVGGPEEIVVHRGGAVEPKYTQLILEHQPPPKRARFDIPSTSSAQNPPDNMLDLKIQLIRREMDNQDRFAAVLDRAEGLLGRLEQRFGVEETVYAGDGVQEWNEQEIIEEQVIHTDYDDIQ